LCLASDADRTPAIADAAVTFDPVTGNPLVLWPQEQRTTPYAVTMQSSERR